jgi:hypothetical protein
MKLKRISFMRVENRFGPADALPKLADMLRYDTAFQSTISPEYIAFPTFRTKYGNLGGNVTGARWHSFGVTLKFLEPAAIETLVRAVCDKPDAWMTYRHPRDEHGAYDYTKLVPVSLEAYYQAKDTNSL